MFVDLRNSRKLVDNYYHGFNHNFVILSDKPYKYLGKDNRFHWSNPKKHPNIKYAYSMEYAHNFIDSTHNWFTTLNMCHGSRKINNLKVILGCLTDLDTGKAGINNFDLKGLINSLPIKPTYTQSSGNGYHLFFLIQPFFVKYNYIKLTKKSYEKIERSINNYCNKFSLAKYGVKVADPKCKDPLREIRMTGSYNWKDKNNPKLCYINYLSGQFYTFKKLLKVFTNYHSKQERLDYHSDYLINSYEYRVKRQKEAKYWALCRLHNDLNRIINKRKYGSQYGNNKKRNHPKHINYRLGKLENSHIKALNGFVEQIKKPSYNLMGHRDYAMYYFINLLVEKEPQITQNDVLSRFKWFVDKILRPKCYIPDNDVNKIITEIQNHWPWPYHNTSYNDIVADMDFNSKLWVTKSAKRENKRQAKNKRNKEIMKLYKQGKSMKNIAKELKISRKTVSRHINS